MAISVAKRNVANLDALLPRQDLFAPVEPLTTKFASLNLSNLMPGIVFDLLTKPDFQRETANWSPEVIADLVDTFAAGRIIPAIILWQNGQKIFVVDGAHRISALIAWVHDDYGAGSRSIKSFGHKIPPVQVEMADKTRALVESKVMKFEDYAKKFGGQLLREIETQWIQGADAAQAATAFLRINQGGTRIDEAETKILMARDSALAISTRAVARGGVGHEYWQKFNSVNKTQVVSLGGTCQKLLFEPPLMLPIKTVDVPLAGIGYGVHVLGLAYDLIAAANKLAVADSGSKAKKESPLPSDAEGDETVIYLAKTKRALEIICSNDPASLGLHPALYFYSRAGDFQPAALVNVIHWIADMEERRRVKKFLLARRKFEGLLLSHPILARPPTHKMGSGSRSRLKVMALYNQVLDFLSDGDNEEEAWKHVVALEEFEFLVLEEGRMKSAESQGVIGARFHRRAKSAGFLGQALSNVNRCALCGGLMHVNGMTADHITSRSMRGTNAPDNARMVHPRCNSERAIFNET